MSAADTSTLRDAARLRRRRFAIAATIGLVVLGASLGVSFLGATGSTEVTVTAASSDFVYPVAASNPLPQMGVEGAEGVFAVSLKYTGDSGIATSGTAFEASNVVLPGWAPVVNSAGTVTTAGDVAIFDATAAKLADKTALRVNMFVTNLPGLQEAYSSFAFPINIYRCAGSCDGADDWVQASAVIASDTYLTNTDGFLSFTLPVGYFYDLTIDLGGSFYTISTADAGNLNPTFYFTALPI